MGNACQTCQEEMGAYTHDPYQRQFTNRPNYIKNTVPVNVPVSDAPNPTLAKTANLPSISPSITAIINQQNTQKTFQKQNLIGTKLQPYQLIANGLIYDGEWKSGVPCGFGKAFYENGGYFQGYFKNGVANSQDGIFIYPDGTFYRGNIKDSSANGKGVLVYKNNQMIYTGEFLNDKPHGMGKQQFKDGSSYFGSFVNGVKEGNGTFKWADGSEYSGMFSNNLMNGQGVQKLANNQTYRGVFVKNKRTGKGILQSPLGIYSGNFNDDKKSGEGQFKFADGRVFTGSFLQNMPEGHGKMTIPNGQIVNGFWKNGQNVKVQNVNKLNASNVSVNRSSNIQNQFVITPRR